MSDFFERLRTFTVVVSLTASPEVEIDPIAVGDALAANAGGESRYFAVPHEPNEHIWELVFAAEDDWFEVLRISVDYVADALATGGTDPPGRRVGLRIVDVQPLDEAEIETLKREVGDERADATDARNTPR